MASNTLYKSDCNTAAIFSGSTDDCSAKEDEVHVHGRTQHTEQGWYYLQRQAAFDMDGPLNVLVPLDATQIENRQNVIEEGCLDSE